MKSSSLSSDTPKRSQEDVNDGDRKPPAKRSRNKKKRTLEALDNSTELPLDALCLVMEFLSPRQLYNLAFSCKTLRGFITTELVVKSALIHCGHAKQTLTELHQVMKKKAMHVPSPLRLLRLVNGKRCEFCNKAAVHRTRSCFGVFACWNCTTVRGLTAPWKLTWVRYKRNQSQYEVIFDHPRMAYSPYGNVFYMWAKHRRWKGEIIGPLACHGDVDAMLEYTTKGHGTLDSYFQKYLLKESDTDEAYQEFNEAYSETWERSEQIAKEREEKKAASKAKTKENKLAKIEKMTEDLKKMLDEPYRECGALKYDKVKYSHDTKGISKRPVVRFHFVLAEKRLKPFAITPSKIRKKILIEIAQEMNEKLRLVTTSFIELDFLSENDAFETALKVYFSDKFTDLKSFFGVVEKAQLQQHRRYCYSGLMNEQFFNLLKARQLICALTHFLNKDLSCLFADDLATEHSTCEKTLAKTVWFDCLDGKGDEDQQYRDAFATMTTEWPKALQGFRGYVAWIDEEYVEDRDRNFKHSYVCDKACSRADLLPLLADEKFEELDKIVSKGFDRYMWHLMR